MKTYLSLMLLAAIPSAADPFINLTFDEPDLSGPMTPVYPGGPLEGDTASILRGWTLLLNGQPQTKMVYSPPGTGGAGVADLFHNAPPNSLSPPGPYSLLLISPFPGQPDIRVRQTGTIPEDSPYLWIASSGYVQAYADGVKIGEVSPVLSSWAFLNVAPLAGKEVSLEFAILPGSSTRFDIFGFTSVPEPSTWALLGLGLAALGWQYRRRR